MDQSTGVIKFVKYSSVFPQVFNKFQIWIRARTDYAVSGSDARLVEFTIDKHPCAYETIVGTATPEIIQLHIISKVDQYGARTTSPVNPVVVSIASHFKSSAPANCPVKLFKIMELRSKSNL